MYDLLSIGTISVDLFFQGKSLTYEDGRFQLAIGGKYVPDSYHEKVGGGGANVAIGVQQHGYRTGIISKIGDNEFQHLIRSKLNDNGVSDYYCSLEKNYQNVSTILLTPNGEKTVIHYQTPHQKIVSTKSDYRAFERTKNVYFGNLPDVSLEEKIHLLQYLNLHNVCTFVNLGVTDCRRPKRELHELLKEVSILIVNGHEFSDIIKKDYDDIDFKTNVVEEHFKSFEGKLLIITEGKKGSFGYYQGAKFHQQAIEPEEIVDTTGAGDGYTAGFIAEYIKSHHIPKAMESGAEYAAKILGRIGAN